MDRTGRDRKEKGYGSSEVMMAAQLRGSGAGAGQGIATALKNGLAGAGAGSGVTSGSGSGQNAGENGVDKPELVLSNRAGESRSPYVRAHKDNPVKWQLWGDEAIEMARRENRLLFLSVGYAACHCEFLLFLLWV